MKTLQAITLGCSKNTVDTEHLLAQVSGSYEFVPEEDSKTPVDVAVINTCGFIGDAKQESIDVILETVQRKERGEVGKIFVFGCLSQRYASSLPELIPEVDAWFGARELGPLVLALGCQPSKEKETERILTSGRPGTACIKISEGCDRRCSYCAIPLIRGPHKSVPMETILQEARALAASGVKELVLIAQDTTYYGLDLYKKRALGELLGKLSGIEGIEWLRIHYSYPAGFPDDVLEQMARNPKVCPYLDIPLQHISDPVLRKMRRPENSAWNRALVRRLREEVPGVVLRTTMMVGHPGEGEDEFAELMDFVREARFERLGAFTYSEEEGTYGADNFADEVPEEVKQSRYDALMELQNGISLDFNLSRVDTRERVLIDGISGGYYICRSRFESPEVDGEILVACGSEPDLSLVGNFADVRIVEADDYDLIAEFI